MANNIAARLTKLEELAKDVQSDGRVWRIVGGGANADAWAFLRSIGETPDPDADRVIRRVFYAPSESGPVCEDTPMKLAS